MIVVVVKELALSRAQFLVGGQDDTPIIQTTFFFFFPSLLHQLAQVLELRGDKADKRMYPPRSGIAQVPHHLHSIPRGRLVDGTTATFHTYLVPKVGNPWSRCGS